MTTSRREFLQGTAVAALAGIAATAAAAPPAPARRRRRSAAAARTPRGMTLLSIRSEHGDTLGVKTDRGILDVRRASLALHHPVPLTLDDLLQEGGAPELAHLVAAAGKSPHADRLY